MEKKYDIFLQNIKKNFPNFFWKKWCYRLLKLETFQKSQPYLQYNKRL